VQKGEDSVKGILALCCDVNWDVRRKGCGALKDAASDVARQHEVRASVDAIAKSLADRMDDRNHKVCIFACCMLHCIMVGVLLAVGFKRLYKQQWTQQLL
jgi:hypothetical protein